MKCGGAGHDGDKIHHKESKRISSHGKVKRMVRIGIQIVDPKDAENGGQDAVAVFVRMTGDLYDGQDEDQADVRRAGRIDPVIDGGQDCCR